MINKLATSHYFFVWGGEGLLFSLCFNLLQPLSRVLLPVSAGCSLPMSTFVSMTTTLQIRQQGKVRGQY